MDLTLLIIDRANVADNKALVHISKKAFDDDSKRFMGKENGGPGGYASEKVNSMMIRNNDYYKIKLHDFTTIGGVIISQKENSIYLQRMFIDPKYQNFGIGQYVLNYLEKLYEPIHEWQLDTPQQNIRTNTFYQKCGYSFINSQKGLNYYKKIIM
ncbi:MAG: family acetyltransferase [Anaerocolumna sp.]|jgi:GNAT superfamily N-acetyltransferase|nr:family acetyltransferase [Anaerocolumna sp.]